MPAEKGNDGLNQLDDINRRLRPALQSYFRKRVGVSAEAEDLTQEVFIRLAQSASRARSPDAYVFRIAANLLRDRARRNKVRSDYAAESRLDEQAGLDPLDPFRVVAARDQLNRLASAIAELPDKTRSIFILYRLENIQKTIIAESFSISVRAVELHIQKAVELLFGQIGDEL